MSWFVYIICSEQDGDYYKGISEDVIKRLEEHNNGCSRFTSIKRPWKMLAYFSMSSKKEAIIEERRIKKLNRLALKRLINSEQNLLK